MADRTPFPDGIGYIDNAWNGLSDVMIRVLMGWEGATRGTHDALVNRDLIEPDSSRFKPRRTARGDVLVAWAIARGLIEP